MMRSGYGLAVIEHTQTTVYGFPDIANVVIVDPQGTPVDDGVNFGQVRITDGP